MELTKNDVEYLDRQDIEDLGFEPMKGYTESRGKNMGVMFKKESKPTDCYPELCYTVIQVFFDDRNVIVSAISHDDLGRTVFDGTIKNKSGLKMILKMCGVS